MDQGLNYRANQSRRSVVIGPFHAPTAKHQASPANSLNQGPTKDQSPTEQHACKGFQIYAKEPVLTHYAEKSMSRPWRIGSATLKPNSAAVILLQIIPQDLHPIRTHRQAVPGLSQYPTCQSLYMKATLHLPANQLMPGKPPRQSPIPRPDLTSTLHYIR
jgi:hypothetical protein